MSRSYKNVFPKKYWVYSVEGLTSLYSVNANTVSNWVKDGLTPSELSKPFLFQGAEVQRFHQRRRERTAITLRPGEFSCFTCKGQVFPDIDTVRDTWSSLKRHIYAAVCPECGAHVSKISNEADRAIVEDCRNPNTSRHCLHEEDRSEPAGIGISAGLKAEDLHCHNEEDGLVCSDIRISAGSKTDDLHFRNDRIIHAWLTYAGRYHVKTIDRHLSAIRSFENLLDGKRFSKLTRDDVAKVRDDLKRRADPTALDSLSSSSIKHIVSYLTAFLTWLMKQEGFKSLPQDLQGYLKLPQAVLASAAPVKQKEYPTLAEAEALLAGMPSRSLIDLRARAIFALAFLGALRADTLISLRIKHVDVARRVILQDGVESRSKAGKSISIFWFPIPKSFEATVIDWIQRLKWLGFTGDDALFPDRGWRKYRPEIPGVSRKSVPVMSTKHAVTEAFAIACREQAVKYTPHSAKHCIAAERDERPLTQLERKAWSENMGHENQQITERHYGKLPEERRFEVLEHIGEKVRDDPPMISDEEKIACFDVILDLIRNR